MSKISWLHLSDLHLGKEIYNEKVVLETLLEDIQNQININHIDLDFIFITGDLTYSGKPKEFDIFLKFTEKLSAITNLTKDNIILVPGNHDVNRSSIPLVAKNSREHLNNRDDISKIIGKEEERKIYTKGLNNYKKFIKNNFSWASTNEKSPLFYTINKRVKDVSISILALNTAWLAYGGSNEKGKIILGERQVREAFDKIENPQMVISLMHHPFDWLEQFDSNDAKGMLERRADFILYGHEHRLDVIGKGSIFGKAFTISAGSTYETRNHLNSYNIVSSDMSTGTATCYFRKFVDINGGFWSEDNTLDGSIHNGKINITLSERLIENLTSNHNNNNTQYKKDLWINPKDSNVEILVPTIPKDLIDKIREGKCILFAGAGTSLDAGLPSWDELLTNMIEQVENCGQLSTEQKDELEFLLASQDFNVVAEFCKDKLGAREFANLIKEKLNTNNKTSITHNLLSEIPFKAAITSNYDNFLEKTHTNYRVILPDQIDRFDSNTISSFFEDDMFPIFKIHGSYETPTSIVLTEKDYRNVIFNMLQYRENLKQLFQDKSLLFIGFSFRDPNINLLLQEIFTITGGMSNTHYAFLNDIRDIKKDFYWKSRNIRVIPYQTIDGSHIVLNKMLENLRDEFK